MQTFKIFGIISALAALTVVGASALANPPGWDAPEDDGAFAASGPERPGVSARQALRLHMELGRYYLVGGDYEAALDHYLAVATFEVPDEIAREHPGAERRGAGAKARAWLMAAVASELLGDREQAVAFAETGQALLPEPGEGRRGPRARGRQGRRGGRGPDMAQGFDRFLEDPAGAAERFGGGASALEARLLALEAELSENAR